MKIEKISDNYKTIGINKASKSQCRFKISAIGFNKKGDPIYKTFNRQRFYKKRGGIHAEMDVMKNAGPSLKYIIIYKINNGGTLRPIHPCKMCAEKANELGIKIYTSCDTEIVEKG